MMGNAKHGHILRQGLTHPAPSSRPSGFGDGISEIESRYRSLVGYNFRLTMGWRQIPGLFLFAQHLRGGAVGGYMHMDYPWTTPYTVDTPGLPPTHPRTTPYTPSV